MRLVVVGDLAACPLAFQWAAALRPMEIRHPDAGPTVEMELTCSDPPLLCFRLDSHRDTVDPSRKHTPFIVSTVALTYFPGDTLARAWVAAAWTGYVMHESLELVTVAGIRPIDPHSGATHDVCLRDGIPAVLTPASLRRTLGVVLTPEAADAMVGA